MSQPVRVAVVGAGAFGRNHVRVLRSLPDLDFVGVYDSDPARCVAIAEEFQVPAMDSLEAVCRQAQAAVIAVPTIAHSAVASLLLECGLDVLVEKPIAATPQEARALVDLAQKRERILQVGHLERYNPAIQALRKEVTLPLFFEIHRMSIFTPRSLDIDVVLDLMIHDLDIVLSTVGEMPIEVRASGINVLSSKVDIANVRLAFPGGCIANLTASRVSTDRIRKLRLFQPHQYFSLDYSKQEGVGIEVNPQNQGISFRPLNVQTAEPLRLELEDFLRCVQTRSQPLVDGRAATTALEVAREILDKIEEHGSLVARSLEAYARSAHTPPGT